MAANQFHSQRQNRQIFSYYYISGAAQHQYNSNNIMLCGVTFKIKCLIHELEQKTHKKNIRINVTRI